MEKTKTNTIFKLFGSFAFLVLANLFSNNVYAEHSISVSTSGSQDINVLTTTGVAISEAKVDIATTCHAGYNLTLSTTVDDNNLYLNGDESYRDNHLYFSPSNGTSSLSESDNTWGYYLPSSSTDSPTSSSVFNAVPTAGQIASLRTPAQTSRDTDINDSISIFYGVKASGSLVAGTYTLKDDTNHNTGSLIYYATLPEDCFKYTVKYNPTGTNTGIAVTGTGTVENQTIAEGITDNLTTDVYGNPTIDGITYYFTGWNTAQDGSGVQYSSGQSVTDLATAGTAITLYAQWTACQSNNVCYFKNSLTAEGTMSPQEATSNTSIVLQAPNYSLSEHGFIGWSEDKNAAIKLANHEPVTIYGPNETIAIGDISELGLHLYAVWLESEGTLQEWDGCEDLLIGDVIALRDARNANTYGVAKLADGKCWTIENMRIDDTVDAATMASGSTALGEGFSVLPPSSSEWDTESTTAIQFNNDNLLNGPLSFGGYYSWPAVVASSENYTSYSEIVETSICPSGWRLPVGGNIQSYPNGDYYILMKKLTNKEPDKNINTGYDYYDNETYSNSIRSYPNNFIYSGYWNENDAAFRNRGGFYWTATSYGSSIAYYFYLDDSIVRPGNTYGNKNHGNVFRCIAAD